MSKSGESLYWTFQYKIKEVIDTMLSITSFLALGKWVSCYLFLQIKDVALAHHHFTKEILTFLIRF